MPEFVETDLRQIVFFEYLFESQGNIVRFELISVVTGANMVVIVVGSAKQQTVFILTASEY